MNKILPLLIACLGLCSAAFAADPNPALPASPLGRALIRKSTAAEMRLLLGTTNTTGVSSNTAYTIAAAQVTAATNELVQTIPTTNVFGFFYASQYGATPNAFCGSNIQAAINAACVAGGGVVVLPAGRFKLGNHLPTPQMISETYPMALCIWSNNITLKGAGKNNTVICFGTNSLAGGTRSMIGSPETILGVAHSQSNIVVDGITFDAEGINAAAGLYDTTQFYGVHGARGLTLRDSGFINNPQNDGIDVQPSPLVTSYLTVEDCYIADNGGDGIGVQVTYLTVANTIIERCRQEGLELYNYETFLNNVQVRDCNHMGSIEGFGVYASGCTFSSTNLNDDAWDMGRTGATVGHAQFVNCTFTDAGTSSTGATFRVNYNGNLEVIGCIVNNYGGRLFVTSSNAARLYLSGNTFGQASYPATYPVLKINKGEDVNIGGNLFHTTGRNLLVTNAIARLAIHDNIFRGDVTLVNLTNAAVGNNVFANNAVLTATNMKDGLFSGNVGTPSAESFNRALLGNGTNSTPSIMFANRVGIYSQLYGGLAFVRDQGFDDWVSNWEISAAGTLYPGAGGNGQIYSLEFLSSAIGLNPGYGFAGEADRDSGLIRLAEDNISLRSDGVDRAWTTATNFYTPNIYIAGGAAPGLTNVGVLTNIYARFLFTNNTGSQDFEIEVPAGLYSVAVSVTVTNFIANDALAQIRFTASFDSDGSTDTANDLYTQAAVPSASALRFASPVIVFHTDSGVIYLNLNTSEFPQSPGDSFRGVLRAVLRRSN